MTCEICGTTKNVVRLSNGALICPKCHEALQGLPVDPDEPNELYDPADFGDFGGRCLGGRG